MKQVELNRIHSFKLAVLNKIYTNERGEQYIGTSEGRLKRYTPVLKNEVSTVTNVTEINNLDSPHALTHQDGGIDEIDVTDLSGELADPQKVTIHKNGTSVGTRPNVNLIEGPGVTLTVLDDAPDDEVDVTITSKKYLLQAGRTTTAAPADTNTNIIHEITIPANTLGANDSIEVIFEYSASGNVGQKTFEVRYGATSGTLGTLYLSTGGVAASNNSGRYLQRITCKNSTSSQEGVRILTGFGTTTTSIITSAINTTSASYIQICIDKATAADTVSINNYEVWINKP